MEPAAPTVVVVDDAPDVRVLVRTRLRLSGSFQVVGEGGNGADAISLAAQHRPSLLVLDVSMPGMDGLEALPQVLTASPSTRVVMYSGFEEHGLGDRARELGAAAFVEKSTPIEDLVDVLLAVLAESPATPPVAEAAGDPSDDQLHQQVLDEHVERFRQIFEQAAIGMATLTLTGHIVRANEELAGLLGQRLDGLVGVQYGDLLLPEDAAQVARALLQVVDRGEQVAQVEHELPGGPRVRVTLAPVRDQRGRPLYLFAQVQDVTAQRAAEAQLRQSEQRFRLLVASVQDYAIFMLDPQGHVASWNAGAQRSKGYSADEIIGQHFRVFYPPGKQAERHPERELDWALRDGRYEEEGWRVRKDGSRFWANVVITAVYDEDGELVGFAKVTRDISAHRLSTEALRQSEQRFRLLVASVQDYAIFMLDPQGHVASWNAGAQRSKGYTADEIIGQHFRAFYPPDVAAAGHPERELEWALRDGSYEEEGWRLRKDGSRFWANVVITAVYDEDGEHVGFAKVTRDTTERRQMLEEQERASQRRAQVADDQAKFLAMTAHELRTPISVVTGTADLLSRHWADYTEPERQESLDIIANNARRLRRLLADLLTVARLDADAVALRAEPVDVERLLEAAATTARSTVPDAKVEVAVPEPLSVLGDADRLAQALDNLIANALRHGDGPVRLTAERAGDVVQVRVVDAGTGVPAEMAGRLFERYATGESKEGTGLGLYIVRELARAHGGDAHYDPPTPQDPSGAFVLSIPTPDNVTKP